MLWDVDHTLLDAGGAGIQLIRRAFTEMFGRDFPHTPALAGRTDRAIQLEVLTCSGVPDPQAELPAFQRLVAGLAPQLGGLVRESGRALPGATEALTALAALADGRGGPDHRGPDDSGPNYSGPLVQSVLTGNMQATAAAKLAALDLDQYPGPAGRRVRRRARDPGRPGPAGPGPGGRGLRRRLRGPGHRADRRYPAGHRGGPAGRRPVHRRGHRGFSAAELAAAGADAVLPDLADTARVLAAIAAERRDTLPSGDV